MRKWTPGYSSIDQAIESELALETRVGGGGYEVK